jgi:Mor family transcriptional regulator
MDTIEMVIDETKDWSGVIDTLALTDTPAIEEEFIALSKEPVEVTLAEVDKERRILMGAVLVPDKKILRKGENGYYNIMFSKETIARASQLYLERGNQHSTNLEHEVELTGQTVVESWLIEDEVHDKSRKFGLDLPVGTWMVSMKVDNDEVWNDYVKMGKVKGFSIEGLFNGRAVEEDDSYYNALSILKQVIKAKIKEDGK